MRGVIERAVHFVGSFPAAGTREAMQTMVDGAGGHLRTLPTGETRRYEFYVEPIFEDLVSQGLLEVAPPRRRKANPNRIYHRVPAGVELRGDTMDLGYLREAREALPIFEELRAGAKVDCGVSQPKSSAPAPWPVLQIGMPTAVTLAFTAMGLSGIPAHRRAFAEATVRAVADVRRELGDEVVVQLEAPAETVFTAKAQPLHRVPDMVVGFGKGIGALAAAAPEGTRFGVHLCLGSRRNRARAAFRSARPLVDLANSVVRHWPRDRSLEYIHGPLVPGELSASAQAEFFAPLADLSLDPDTAFYAGFVDDGVSEQQQIQTLRLIEQALGRPVDGVGSPCGLGRRSREDAAALVARAAAVAAAQ